MVSIFINSAGGAFTRAKFPTTRIFLPRRFQASVTGTIYSSDDQDAPKVSLFTKEGCTLCDKVKDVLLETKQGGINHSLDAIDITDEEHAVYFDKYKWDIPVLHLNGEYWAKHRLSKEEAEAGLKAAIDGSFVSPFGEPNAKEMERK